MIFVATNSVAASLPGRKPISLHARSKAIDIDKIVSGSNACPEKSFAIFDRNTPRLIFVDLFKPGDAAAHFICRSNIL
jgi:hypothetical protein